MMAQTVSQLRLSLTLTLAIVVDYEDGYCDLNCEGNCSMEMCQHLLNSVCLLNLLHLNVNGRLSVSLVNLENIS